MFKDYKAKEENRVANTTSKSASKNALKSVALHLATSTVQRNIESFCNKKDKEWDANNTSQQRFESAVVTYFPRCINPVRRAGEVAFVDLLHQFQPKINL